MGSTAPKLVTAPNSVDALDLMEECWNLIRIQPNKSTKILDLLARLKEQILRHKRALRDYILESSSDSSD
jgi:hypothetical protein